LDARAPEAAAVRDVVASVEAAAREAAVVDGVEVRVAEESWSGGADFRPELRARLAHIVAEQLGTSAELPTGAGHDAAVLAAFTPTAMLFVRNPSGVSHDPAEWASRADCLAGVDALTAVLEDLVS
jgi:N-carbamoyl-L-amino-acid hydrolase